MLSTNFAPWTGFLVSIAWKSVAVLAAAWLVSLLLRKSSAAARHTVWTAAFAGLLALPLLSISLPSFDVPVATILTTPDFSTTASSATQKNLAGGISMRQAQSIAWETTFNKLPWRTAILFLWVGGVLLALLRMTAAWVRLVGIRRAATPLADSSLFILKRALDIRHEVDVLETAAGSMPLTFGVMRPAVLMPADCKEWDAERRRVVLLHELAHVRRGDAATHLMGRLALSVYWWNPLAWFAWSQFLKERECATDDLVLAAGAGASDYAGHLLGIARTMQSPGGIGWAAIAMARQSQLEGRLRAILDGHRNRGALGRGTLVIAGLAAISLIAPLAALQAQSEDPKLVVNVEETIREAAAQKNHEILEKAARNAASLRDYDAARKLLDAALMVSPDDSVTTGRLLLKLGALEKKRDRYSDAAGFFERALPLLGNKPEAVQALTGLGVAAMAKKENGKAEEYFLKAQTIDPAKAAVAKMWLGVMKLQTNQTAESESFFKSALAVQDADSPETATTMELYARLLNLENRKEEADAMRERAAQIRKEIGARPLPSTNKIASTAVRIGAGVTPPKLTFKVEPKYTEEARIAKYQGTCLLSVEIGVDGLAHDPRIIRGLGLGLDDHAIDAIKQWKFQPGMKDGVPVRVAATIEVNFRLL